MFVNIIQFPAVRKGKDREFRRWFAWSNTVYAKFPGFVSRRLLAPAGDKGNYAAIVEHKSKKTFMAMHLSEERQRAWDRVKPLLAGSPAPGFYQVVSMKIKITRGRQ